MDQRNQQIVHDYVSGIQTKDLAEKYNISKNQIRKIVKMAGVLRSSGGKPTYDPQVAIDLWNDGNTLDQIAAQLKVNRNSVYSQLKKFNIDTSDRSIINRTEMKLLLEEGKSDEEISNELNCSKIRVEQIRRDEFGVYDGNCAKSSERINELLTYLDENPMCKFEHVRSKFSDIYYGTLISKFDLAFPNRRDNGFRCNLIYDGDDRVEEICRLLRQGDSKQSIYDRFPITSNSLNNIIDKYVQDYQPREYKIPQEIYNNLTDKQWCESAHDRSYSKTRDVWGFAGIAKYEFNNKIGVGTIIKYFNKHGLYAKTLSELYPELNTKEWLEKQYEIKSYAHIADDLGVSHPTIRKALTDHGIDIKRDANISKIEKQLLESIRSIYSGQIIENDRSVIAPYEIDILFPNLKIGIEVCGLYWHSERFKSNDYHVNKMLMCEQKGYRLITIFEDELTFELDKVVGKISNILNTSTKRVFARKCEVVELSSSQAAEFFNANHIQGYVNASVRIGLKCGDDIVAAMTFKKHINGVYDLSRFASSVNVVGGFSKLLNYFKNNTEYTKIFTFADLRWSSRHNNVYVVNGFREVHVTKPAYFYYDYSSKRRLHRMNFQKKNLNKLLKEYDPVLTERQNANNNGYYAIYDCGNVKYEMCLIDTMFER